MEDTYAYDHSLRFNMLPSRELIVVVADELLARLGWHHEDGCFWGQLYYHWSALPVLRTAPNGSLLMCMVGFNDTLAQPNATDPLGNPAYPGYTATNGPNWVDFLTTT